MVQVAGCLFPVASCVCLVSENLCLGWTIVNLFKLLTAICRLLTDFWQSY